MNFLFRLFIMSVLAFQLDAKIIQDTNNNDVIVPDVVNRVFGSSPPMNYLIYAIDPNKMIGLNFKANNANNFATKELLHEKFLSLPVLGSFHGGGKNINLETLLKDKPDLVLVWQDDMVFATVKNAIDKTKLPTITIPFRKIEEMPRAITFAADAMNESERGKELSDYAAKIILHVSKGVSDLKPTRYYYAEGVDGLSTECDESFHVEALNFAGGENVHKCQQSGLLGLEKINFEKLLTYDPDVIIVQSAFTYKAVTINPLWKNLRAVKNHNVHLVPNSPFNWIDRPPSFMRILGVEWLAQIFHPKEYKIDMNKQIKEFYALFMNVKLTDKQVENIMGMQHLPLEWKGCSK
ncbi:ABC transporter substrate-binding protein [bacterium]|nr:ABC transporter substrate-binding protein [bacterium]MBU1883541.1 ABC transporter substrate-binding protein [bacterium]